MYPAGPGNDGEADHDRGQVGHQEQPERRLARFAEDTKPGRNDGTAALPAGGVGGGTDYPSHVILYVGVPDVEAALREAERLGGQRQMGPERAPTRLADGTSDPRAT